MEDISRELEKEIAQTKPKPYKQDLKSRILIIDDFGRMKSGEFLKKMLIGLSAGTAVFFLSTILFASLYIGLSSSSGGMKDRLEKAEKKLEQAKREKEVLMARLVIQGKAPVEQIAANDSTPGTLASVPKKKQNPQVKQPKPKAVPPPVAQKAPAKPSPVGTLAEKESQIPNQKPRAEQAGAGKMVSIEKFTVVRDTGSKDLLVRFDIRNVSTAPGDVSGRIFTLLKPDEENTDQWLVVPRAKLKNGVPSVYRKGQYFSIAHFKPVKFRIKNQSNPERFKRASIYIFNNQGQMMLEKHITISEQSE